jgi:3-hydroxybutyryl-CoA dehydrogenase
MGSGIAEVVATAGIEAVLREVDEEAVERTRARIRGSLDRAAGRGSIADSLADDAFGRLTFTTHLHDLAHVDLVIEAVPEDLELKMRVLAEVAEVVDADSLIASNTSSIAIAQLASAVPRPERVLGLHFFSPVPAMELVEVVRSIETSSTAIEAGVEFVRRIGKSPIETKDRSGFIVNMLLVPYLMAAVRMYEEGFATREAIDDGMRLGCGYPMGPLRLCDLIGIDVLYSVCAELYEEFKRPEYAPPPLLKRMTAARRLGRKVGRGFYDYAESPTMAVAT